MSDLISAIGWRSHNVVELVEMVECPRVDVTIRDNEGWTLLMVAIARRELGECRDYLTPDITLIVAVQTSPR